MGRRSVLIFLTSILEKKETIMFVYQKYKGKGIFAYKNKRTLKFTEKAGKTFSNSFF